ncbi:MAG: hypothetical protein HYV42_04830 [Candidatus Magasanikbacteria bacterium]|nr:hypothetical protein [Candidatus Magasanikbacteria bacterium]
MKGCLLLQRRFVFIGHELVKIMRERHGITDWCAYVTTRSSWDWLRAQTDVPYSHLVFEADIYRQYQTEKLDLPYLRALERDYGIPNLWPFLNTDRVIRYNLLRRSYPSDTSVYTHEEMLRLLQATARAAIKFLDEAKPDFIIFSVVANLSGLLLYYVAKKRGIKTIVMDAPRIGIRYFVSERYDASTYLAAAFAALRQQHDAAAEELRQPARRWLQEFQARPTYYLHNSPAAAAFSPRVAPRSEYFNWLLPSRAPRSLRWFLKSFWDYARNPYRDDYDTIKPWHEVYDKLIRKLRILRGYGDLYDYPAPGEKYAYFALHTEPEAYPIILAPFYTDQQWLISQVARSLPVEYKLYVKDHPGMYGLRPRRYYRELKKIPNVRLVPPGYSGFDLIQGSDLTITITGTSAWEAVLLKKPVVTFGPMYYSSLSMVKQCRAIAELPYLIKEQLENFRYDEAELVDFIAACLAESVEVDLVQLWDIEGGSRLAEHREELARLAGLIAGKVR